MSQLTEEECKLYTEVFKFMDQDGDHLLTAEELSHGCRRLGLRITEEEQEASFNATNISKDGKITLDEFLAIIGHIEENNIRAKKEAKLRRAFRDMDRDGDGLLMEKELLDGLRQAGYNISRDQAKKLCSDLDQDQDGKISFEEFIQMFQL